MDKIKFYAKLAVVKARAALLFFAPVKPNTDGWGNRILLINLDLIGDIVMFTAVLRHYRAALPGKKIYLLLNGSSGVSPALVKDYVDEILSVDAEAFKSQIGYSYSFIKQLREIGFATVVEHNPGAEFVGKVIAVELGAREVIGYYGFAIDEALPSSENFAMGLRYFRRVLSKKFTKIIPSMAEPPQSVQPRRLTHMILHYAAIFEGVTGVAIKDFVPRLPDPLPSDEPMKALLREHGVSPGAYCLVSLGTSTPHKEWPVERFAELAEIVLARKIPIVITGGKKDVSKSESFVKAIEYVQRESRKSNILDLTGRTSILEAASLVKFSKLVMSNDTSIAHFAVAFKRPSLTILWLAQPGRTSIYGYHDINKWIFKEDFACFADNGRCARTVGSDDPSPCVAGITVADAKRELEPLLDYISSDKHYPVADFSLTV